jgi:hypothetical protein
MVPVKRRPEFQSGLRCALREHLIEGQFTERIDATALIGLPLTTSAACAGTEPRAADGSLDSLDIVAARGPRDLWTRKLITDLDAIRTIVASRNDPVTELAAQAARTAVHRLAEGPVWDPYRQRVSHAKSRTS